MLLVKNNFNKNGLPQVYIALFRCLWFTVGGIEPFRRVLRSGSLLLLKKNRFAMRTWGLMLNFIPFGWNAILKYQHLGVDLLQVKK